VSTLDVVARGERHALALGAWGDTEIKEDDGRPPTATGGVSARGSGAPRRPGALVGADDVAAAFGLSFRESSDVLSSGPTTQLMFSAEGRRILVVVQAAVGPIAYGMFTAFAGHSRPWPGLGDDARVTAAGWRCAAVTPR
jgi:hypothetical protein